MSCNGCRVLRKGCSDTCILRSSLQWIESPEAQGHATVFVAKFFGRAGMISFISAVSESERPALFQSLLYEACGRTVNPVFGAVGLLWSGNWGICQAAVETVLKGGSLRPAAATLATPPKLTHPLACRSNPPQHMPPSSMPLISLKPSLKRPQSAELITGVPSQHLKVSTHPQELLKETSTFTSEAATDDQEHMKGLSFKQASQASSHPEEDFADRNKEARYICIGRVLAPVARRAWPNIMPSVSSAMVREQGCEEAVTAREESHVTTELDLTLNSHRSLADRGVWKIGSPTLIRVSSPSFSVNSEGSVTTSDTAEYSMSCPRASPSDGHHGRNLLRLL